MSIDTNELRAKLSPDALDKIIEGVGRGYVEAQGDAMDILSAIRKGQFAVADQPGGSEGVDDADKLLREMHHVFASETGFMEAVRQDSGMAYPWEPWDHLKPKIHAYLASKEPCA